MRQFQKWSNFQRKKTRCLHAHMHSQRKAASNISKKNEKQTHKQAYRQIDKACKVRSHYGYTVVCASDCAYKWNSPYVKPGIPKRRKMNARQQLNEWADQSHVNKQTNRQLFANLCSECISFAYKTEPSLFLSDFNSDLWLLSVFFSFGAWCTLLATIATATTTCSCDAHYTQIIFCSRAPPTTTTACPLLKSHRNPDSGEIRVCHHQCITLGKQSLFSFNR